MKKLICYTFTALLFAISCKKEFDMPPVKHLPDGAKITIATLKQRFNPERVYTFSGDTSLYCVVIADEASGNLYKDVFVRDASGAIHVKFTEAGGLSIGDSIRIRLNGVVLNHYSNLIQLDSVNAVDNVVKLASGIQPQPEEITIAQALDVTRTAELQSRLIKLNGVEFLEASRNQPFANASTKAAGQHTLQDCSGARLVVRTSGYAYFANHSTPGGNGSLVAILSQFNNSMQLILRNPDELTMAGALCPAINPTNTPNAYLFKDFNDNSVTSGGWSTYYVTGSIPWTTSTKGGATSPYCQISNYISGNIACETWLISPAMNLSAAANPVLTFKNACNYTGPVLELYVSMDYTNGSPASATWTQLAFTASTGGFTFVNSGSIALSAFKSSNTRIAFKYSGTNSSGSTWEVEDVTVKED